MLILYHDTEKKEHPSVPTAEVSSKNCLQKNVIVKKRKNPPERFSTEKTRV